VQSPEFKPQSYYHPKKFPRNVAERIKKETEKFCFYNVAGGRDGIAER
jgi:hypothetical protein